MSSIQLLLKPREAAQALSISPSYLWQLTSRGVVPVVRLGSRLLYDLDALRKCVQAIGAQQYVPCAALRRKPKLPKVPG